MLCISCRCEANARVERNTLILLAIKYDTNSLGLWIIVSIASPCKGLT